MNINIWRKRIILCHIAGIKPRQIQYEGKQFYPHCQNLREEIMFCWQYIGIDLDLHFINSLKKSDEYMRQQNRSLLFMGPFY